MPAPETPVGAPCWVELFTPDTDAAVGFYGELFGWTATEPSEEYGGYRMFLHGDRPTGGLMRNDGTTEGPNAWTVYLSTSNAEETAAAAEELGGTVVAPPMAVGDLGHMAVMVDPAGATVGAWQAGTFPGLLVQGEVGEPVWFETLSRDYDRSVAFYRDAFGWVPSTMSDTPEFRYTTLGEGERAVAGIMDATAFLGDQPSRWQFYLQVADTDATVGAAQELGGLLLRPVDDSPYGRLALMTDPAGAQFALMGPNAAS